VERGISGAGIEAVKLRNVFGGGANLENLYGRMKKRAGVGWVVRLDERQIFPLERASTLLKIDALFYLCTKRIQ